MSLKSYGMSFSPQRTAAYETQILPRLFLQPDQVDEEVEEDEKEKMSGYDNNVFLYRCDCLKCIKERTRKRKKRVKKMGSKR